MGGFSEHLLASARATSTTNFDAVGGGMGEFRAQLTVPSATPSGATLNVAIEDSVNGASYFGLASFVTVGASPGVSHVVSVATPFAGKVRARAVIAGGGDFTFSVLLHGKR